jgi:hypothetical protein
MTSMIHRRPPAVDDRCLLLVGGRSGRLGLTADLGGVEEVGTASRLSPDVSPVRRKPSGTRDRAPRSPGDPSTSPGIPDLIKSR